MTGPSIVEQALAAPTWNGDNDPVFIDWPDFWAREHHDEEWLYQDVFALHRGHALYAGWKQGKSLFVFWICAQLAITRTDVDIIYLDYEMTEDDLYERLDDMGHGPHSDLARLHYALLPSLPPLDTGEGAAALLELCNTVQSDDRHLFVVIDTTGRAVQGEENSNDTIREFYRWTGTPLKRRQITWARLDHAGKDTTAGQRGGSAKGDDVDVIWRLTKGDNGITLHRDGARMSWVPETLTFTQTDNPLTYEPGTEMWPEGTKEMVAELDRLEVPVDASYPKAKAMGVQGRKSLVLKALKFRRQEAGTAPGTALDWLPGNRNGNRDGNNPPDQREPRREPPGTATGGCVGTGSPP